MKQLAEETALVTEEFKKYYVPVSTGQSVSNNSLFIDSPCSWSVIQESCANMLKQIATFCEDFRFYWKDEKRSVAKKVFFNTEKARRVGRIQAKPLFPCFFLNILNTFSKG